MRSSVVATALLAGLAADARAHNYPDIRWKTARTEHFVVHYYDEVAWTAGKVASVAEEVYAEVTGIYGHEPPRKTHIVVRDDEDTSNGYAVYSLGFITLWASPSSLSLRGRHDWIREVLTHEFSHVVSLQAAARSGWMVEGIRIGGVENGDTNVNTDFGVTMPLPNNNYVRWWAEGTAQLDAYLLGRDFWDTSRDMLLRSAVLEDRLLTFDQMRNITVRENFDGELVYNQSFSFLRWLRETYGGQANLRIVRTKGRWWWPDFDGRIRQAVGKDARTLYDEWKSRLRDSYARQVEEIRARPAQGERVELVPAGRLAREDPRDRPFKDGVQNAYPRFSPDGRWFSWADGGTLRLRYLDHPFLLAAPEEDTAAKGQKPAPLSLALPGRHYAWAPDSRRLIASRREPNVLRGYPYYDLHAVDLGPLADLRADYLARFRRAEGDRARRSVTRRYLWKRQAIVLEPRRLTRKLRATHVAWSPDGTSIALSRNGDGRRRLCLADPDGRNVRDLLAVGGDAEATDPAWSPDSKWVAFTFFNHRQADIWVVAAEGGTPRPLTMDAADDREPAFSPDGKYVYFASDRSGIHQIYRLPFGAPAGTEPEAVTRVETGAFMPHPAADNATLLYLRFSSAGYKPYRIPLPAGESEALQPPPTEGLTEEARLQLAAETAYAPIRGKRYFLRPRPLRLFPSLILEDSQLKAGVAAQISDVLEKHNLTALALFGSDQDYQVSYANRMFHPEIFATYTAYIRNNAFAFVSDGDALADEPRGNVRDNIQFVDAGFRQDLRLDRGLPGRHDLSLWYGRRFVDRRIGFPLFFDGAVATSFRYITNDELNFRWSYQKVPSQLPRDFDVNPRNAAYATLGYALVHTDLFTADTSIREPNRRYWHHEVALELAKYAALNWPWPLWRHHTLWFRFNGGVKSRDVTRLDEFYLGGRINFRAFGQITANTLFFGYEDFSISGETMLLLSTGYTFPIARAIDRKLGIVYLDGVFASLFAEAGNAWSFGEVRNLYQNPSRNPALGQGQVLLEDVGAEVKVKMFLFNDFNAWNSVFRVAYGFQDSAKHGFSDGDSPVRFYLGIGSEF